MEDPFLHTKKEAKGYSSLTLPDTIHITHTYVDQQYYTGISARESFSSSVAPVTRLPCSSYVRLDTVAPLYSPSPLQFKPGHRSSTYNRSNHSSDLTPKRPTIDVNLRPKGGALQMTKRDNANETLYTVGLPAFTNNNQSQPPYSLPKSVFLRSYPVSAS